MIVISDDFDLPPVPPRDPHNPFCDCGRAALPGRAICRTCYEDACRRTWREERRQIPVSPDMPPIRYVPPRIRRELMRAVAADTNR